MKKIIILFLGFLLFAFTKPAYAVQFKSGTDINFSKDQKIDETTFVSGNNIEFDSTLNGDLLCVGRNITITGNIKGDVLCAGQNIKVSGIVDGNVRVAGQSVSVDATVSRNLYVVSQDLTLTSKSNIKGDVLFGAQTIDMSGIAGRDLAGAGEKITISGSLLRNAMVTMTNLDLTDKAKVGGNFDYFVEQKVATSQMMISNKSIKGELRRHEIVMPEKPKMEVAKKVEKITPTLELIKTVFGILSFTLLAFVLLYFSASRTASVIGLIDRKPVVSGLVGLATFVVAPVAFMIIAITVIGLPIFFVVLMIYIVSFFLATLYSSIWVGQKIMKFTQTKSSLYLSAFVGCLVIGLVSLIPVIGWLIFVCLFMMGLGAQLLSFIPEK